MIAAGVGGAARGNCVLSPNNCFNGAASERGCLWAPRAGSPSACITPQHSQLILYNCRYDDARRLLKHASLQIDQHDHDGNTPLMLACKGGQGRLVKLCLRKGANINAQNTIGDTPLHLAAAAGHRAITKHLLQSGASPCIANKAGITAEHLIIKSTGSIR